MITFRPLNSENFLDFLGLLQQRGDVPEIYYRWKYLQQPNAFFPTGYIAYSADDIPVGCIGIICQTFIDSMGNENQATWFADWFVSKSARGSGVGLQLLKTVYQLTHFAFGAPGPGNAQIMAEKVGYNKKFGFNEYIFLCKPYKVGFFRFRDGILKRVIRSVFYRMSTKTRDVCAVTFREIDKYSALDFFAKSSQSALSFSYSGCYLSWLIEMPDIYEDSIGFKYFKSNLGCLFVLKIDIDTTGLCVAKIIVDSTPLDKNTLYPAFARYLSTIGVDYLKIYHKETTPGIISFFEKNEIPQFSGILEASFDVSIASLESRWVNIKMH